MQMQEDRVESSQTCRAQELEQERVDGQVDGQVA